MTRTALHPLVAALCAATVLLSGCSAAQPPLPPVGAAELVPVFAEALAPLGLQLTDRGGLVDVTDYQPDPDGTHLSLYVEPVGDRDDEQYVDGLVSVTAVFAADVFDRWPALESFDVCQEAVGEDGAQAVVTQVTLTREAAATVDWPTATLQDLVTAVRRPDSHLLVVDDEVRERVRTSLEG